MSSVHLLSAFILLTIGLVSATVINVSGNDCSTGSKKSPELNWKQCAWNNGDGNPADSGAIHFCQFHKKATNTHLRVVYQGNIRMIGDKKCSRWYFTFNGNECSGPLPIDGIYGTFAIAINSHQAVTIEGLCSGIPAGVVKVELKLGICKGLVQGDAWTSWKGHSRIIIEEVNPPQP